MITILDRVPIRGWVTVELRCHGELVYVETVKNDILDVGYNVIRDLLLRSGRPPAAIAFGDDDGSLLALAGSNTRLGNERFRKRILRRDSANRIPKWQTLMLQSEGNGGGTVTYRELGLADSTIANEGNMLARAFVTAFNKTASVEATATWRWEIGG